MVVGVGIDIASVARFDRSLRRFGAKMVARILSVAERDALPQHPRLSAQHLAGRFAIKEAAAKALGDLSAIGWHDIQVLLDPMGTPKLMLHGIAAKRAELRRVSRTFVSLSHDAGIAAAVVVLESLGDT